MKHLNLFSILFTLILLLLIPNLTAASFTAEAGEIPYQINNSDRIVIGTVSKIDMFRDHMIATVKVNEWLYNSLPTETIKVRSGIGTNIAMSTEPNFIQNESVLLMLKDINLDQQLFHVAIGEPGKRPVSDRDAVVKELKSLSKWPEENQTENKTNKTEVVENAGTVEQEENQTENKTNDTGMTDNAGTTDEQEESSNQTQKSNTTPFMSPVSAIAVILGAIVYIRRK
ncbi:hypothetical protein [Methanosarcina sp. UBA411]|mgnify:CR=1 FL=1|jgi:hypothetical protein|uniref:hypothetical protein n=1 Tax=Methanosarcina sp. UBA411 TaxID=1915589 RepID=UPI0025E5E01F|nr:hypothetical protein [Methanosarcina sp. UBA411]